MTHLASFGPFFLFVGCCRPALTSVGCSVLVDLLTYFLPAAVINNGGLPSSHIFSPCPRRCGPLVASVLVVGLAELSPRCFPLSAYFHRVFVGLRWPSLAAVSLCGPALAF